MDVLLIILTWLVLLYGWSQIDKRLPKAPDHENYQYFKPTEGVRFRIDTLIENDLEIAWVSEWRCGREFTIAGTNYPYPNENVFENKLQFGERVVVKVTPRQGWFENSRFGIVWIGNELHISLPLDIARHVLEDLRHNLNQIAMVDIVQHQPKRKGSKAIWNVVGFTLSDH